MNNLFAVMKKLVVSFRDFLLGFLGLISVVAAIAMTIADADRLPAATLLFTAGLLLSVFSSLSRFEFIKGLGIDLKMREIDEKVDHVERLAEKVAKASTITAEFCMEVMSRIGRYSGPMPPEVELRLVRDMSTQLLSLRVEKSRVDAILEPWRNTVVFDLLLPGRKALDHAVQKIQQDIEQKIKELRMPIDVTSAEFIELERQRLEASDWHQRVQNIWRKSGLAQVRALEETYKGLTRKYGKSIVADPTMVEETIRHGAYFSENREFLDEKYWIDVARRTT